MQSHKREVGQNIIKSQQANIENCREVDECNYKKRKLKKANGYSTDSRYRHPEK